MRIINLSNLKAFIFYCMVFNMINAQTTTDCGTTYTCFLSASSCVDTACGFIYKWKNNSNNIDFVLAAKVSSTSNRWLGIGFSNDQSMGSDSVVICKSTNVVQTYYNDGKSSSVLNSSNPTFGLSSASVTTSNGFLICSFSRQIKNSAYTNFFDLSQSYYILAAMGSLLSSDISQHSSFDSSSSKLAFSITSITSSSSATLATTLSTAVTSTSRTTSSGNSGPQANMQTEYSFKILSIIAFLCQFSIYWRFIYN